MQSNAVWAIFTLFLPYVEKGMKRGSRAYWFFFFFCELWPPKDSTGMKLWKKRWFVLSDMCLYYYRGKETQEPEDLFLLLLFF